MKETKIKVFVIKIKPSYVVTYLDQTMIVLTQRYNKVNPNRNLIFMVTSLDGL